MVVYVVRWFRRWMGAQGLLDRDLCRAVREMSHGLIDADLGGGLVKKRIARNGQGKRGGFRTIVARRQEDVWLFIYGFAKNARENVSSREVNDYRETARDFLSLAPKQLARQIDDGNLSEVNCDA